MVFYPRELIEDSDHRKPSIVFGCEDTEVTYRELKGRGVEFEQQPTKMAWGTIGIFIDPDSNELVLSQGR